MTKPWSTTTGTSSILRRQAPHLSDARLEPIAVVVLQVMKAAVALTAEIDGNFDKKGLPSPLVLAFYFCLSGSKISALVIVHNHPAT